MDCVGTDKSPKIDEVLIMAASGLFLRWGKKALVPFITPWSRIPKPQSQSSSVESSTVCDNATPALLKTISTAPCSSITFCGNAKTASLSLTSITCLETPTL